MQLLDIVLASFCRDNTNWPFRVAQQYPLCELRNAPQLTISAHVVHGEEDCLAALLGQIALNIAVDDTTLHCRDRHTLQGCI